MSSAYFMGPPVERSSTASTSAYPPDRHLRPRYIGHPIRPERAEVATARRRNPAGTALGNAQYGSSMVLAQVAAWLAAAPTTRDPADPPPAGGQHGHFR